MTPPDTVLEEWLLQPDAIAAVLHALSHAVVSQVLHPEVAAFMPACSVKLRTWHDAQCCVTACDLPFTDEVIVQALAQLPLLTRLNTNGQDVVFADIARLTSLQELCFVECDDLDAGALAELQTLTQLRRLSLHDCAKFAPSDLAVLPRKFERLEQLDVLDTCSLDKEAVEAISRLNQLQRLEVSGFGCVIDAGAMAALSRNLTQLRHLEMLYVVLDQQCMRHISNMASLQELHLSADMSPEQLCHFPGKLSALSVLVLSWRGHIEAECLAYVSRLPKLRRLVLSCSDVDANGLAEIAKSPILRELNLDFCGVCSDGVHAIAKCLNLRSLSLRHCAGVDTRGFALLCRHLTKLQDLTVSNCTHIQPRAFAHVPQLLNLKVLRACSCHVGGLNDDSVISKLKDLKHLRTLDLSDCDGVDAKKMARMLRFVTVQGYNTRIESAVVDSSASTPSRGSSVSGQGHSEHNDRKRSRS